jgi:hypothetical protein
MESTIRGEIRAAIRAVPNNVVFSDMNALVITDALGETISLPWSVVPSYNVRSTGLLPGDRSCR